MSHYRNTVSTALSLLEAMLTYRPLAETPNSTKDNKDYESPFTVEQGNHNFCSVCKVFHRLQDTHLNLNSSQVGKIKEIIKLLKEL